MVVTVFLLLHTFFTHRITILYFSHHVHLLVLIGVHHLIVIETNRSLFRNLSWFDCLPRPRRPLPLPPSRRRPSHAFTRSCSRLFFSTFSSGHSRKRKMKAKARRGFEPPTLGVTSFYADQKTMPLPYTLQWLLKIFSLDLCYTNYTRKDYSLVWFG